MQHGDFWALNVYRNKQTLCLHFAWTVITPLFILVCRIIISLSGLSYSCLQTLHAILLSVWEAARKIHGKAVLLMSQLAPAFNMYQSLPVLSFKSFLHFCKYNLSKLCHHSAKTINNLLKGCFETTHWAIHPLTMNYFLVFAM